jgi:hypothetical protein
VSEREFAIAAYREAILRAAELGDPEIERLVKRRLAQSDLFFLLCCVLGPPCQSASNRPPGSARKGDPLPALGQARPGSEQERPARVAQCPHERRSGARGRCLFAHRGKPGWHSGAVFEAPALVAGFDDFAMMGEAVEERGCHLGVAEHDITPQQ